MRGRPWVPLGVDLILDGQPYWLLYSIIPCLIVFFFRLLNASEDLIVMIFLILSGVCHQNMAITDGCPPSPKYK